MQEVIFNSKLIQRPMFHSKHRQEKTNRGHLYDVILFLHIAYNPVLHEHIEIDSHFIHEKILSGQIVASFVNSSDQLPSLNLRAPRISYINLPSWMHMIYMHQHGGGGNISLILRQIFKIVNLLD